MHDHRSTNRVLVQERRKSWPGITFPGGHIDDGESITAATIREVAELPHLDLASGFRERLPMFVEGRGFEGFATWNDRGHNALTIR